MYIMTTVAPTTPGQYTTPSGIIVPAPSSPPPASPGPIIVPGSGLVVPGRDALVLPGAGSDYTRTPSGLFVPAHQGVQLLGSNGLVVVDAAHGADMSAARMYHELQDGYAAIAARSGDAAAHILTDQQRAIVDAVAVQERHDKAVKAFMDGRREAPEPAAATK
jgi:hypothetical protein